MLSNFISHTAITCTSLSPISNGVLAYGPDSTDPFNFGTIASYTCDDGFYLTSGSDVRTCGGDGLNTIGSWNGAAPVCLCKYRKICYRISCMQLCTLPRLCHH